MRKQGCEKVKLVSVTPDAEQTMAYIAWTPNNQDNEKFVDC